MNMKAGLMRVLAACVIVLVVVNVVLLAVPFEHNATFWVSYIFVWLGVALLAAVNYYLFNSARTGKAALYRASLVSVSLGYLGLALLASIVIMAVGGLPFWVALAVHVVLLGGCLLLLLGGDTGAQLVEDDEARTRAETSFVLTLKTQVAAALAVAGDDRSRQALQSLSEQIRFSDPVSGQAAAFVESQLLALLGQMNAAVSAGSAEQVEQVCAQMSQLLDQRNAIVRETK